MSSNNAYHGSCHCGAIKYQVKLLFPTNPDYNPKTTIRIYKCNCTVCQKMGFFHCRPYDLPNDFILTSPSSIDELGVYKTEKCRINWYFCKNCGCRPFATSGQWEQKDLDINKWAGREGGDGKMEKVLVFKDEEEGAYNYMSVNAVTLETGEGGVDLKEWHEKGWIAYVENREKKEKTLGGPKPHAGGMS
jgi:hypothetical protein